MRTVSATDLRETGPARGPVVAGAGGEHSVIAPDELGLRGVPERGWVRGACVRRNRSAASARGKLLWPSLASVNSIDPGRGQIRTTSRLNADLRRLRWATIVLPVLFFAFLDVLRESTGVLWYSPLGLALTYVGITAVVTLFAAMVFKEIERSEARAAGRTSQVLALNRLATTSAEDLDLNTLMARALEQVMAATGADAGLVCEVNANAREHSALCARGFSSDVEHRIQRAKLDADPVASRVVSTGQPVVYRDVMNDPVVRAGTAREGIRAGISVPLIASGVVNGIVAIGYRHERELSPDDHVFLESVGRHLGLAIHNARLYEDSLTQNRELAALLQVQEAASSSLELDDVLARALEVVTKLTTADAGEIWLQDAHVLAPHHGGSGRSVGLLLPTPASAEPAVLKRAAIERASVRVTDADATFDDGLRAAGFRSCVATPLLSGGRLVGVLVLAGSDPAALSRPSERLLIDTIGEQIAAAIENAWLHREIRNTSILEERERISREMHDGLSQVLGYVNTQVLAVRKLIETGQVDAAGRELGRLDEAARALYSDVRENILALRSSPARGGVQDALREYIASYGEMFGIRARLDLAEDMRSVRLAPAVEIQLIRIVQEAMANVRKHAAATAVTTSLSAEGGNLRVEIADDGCGFDPAILRATGRPRFGLQMMRERAVGAGGTFEVESVPKHGTRVIVRFPVLS